MTTRRNYRTLMSLLVALLASLLTAGGAFAIPANQATGGTAGASSELGTCCGSPTPFFASRAIDGNRAGNTNSLIFHTNAPETSAPSFFEVTLPGDRYLDRIEIFPRTNAVQGSVGNYRVDIYNVFNSLVFTDTYLATTHTGDRPWGTADVRNVVGNRVRLTRLSQATPNVNFLTFAEFEVFGQATPIAENVAAGKPATASAPGFGTAIATGNDGNIDSHYGHPGNPIYHSAAQGVGQFWQVDLGSTQPLDYLNIYARADGVTSTNVRLSVRDENNLEVTGVNVNLSGTDLGGQRYDVTTMLPAATFGRYVRVETLGNEFLAFGELEAFAGAAGPTPTALSLADIVGGGNGQGTGGNAGIRVTDGVPTNAQRANTAGGPVNVYHPSGNPFVDGVFVPDGDGGATMVPVSSTGLMATGINDTNGAAWDEIWNGHNTGVSSTLVFNSILGMHASKGITFDLDAIEQAYPGFNPNDFSAFAALGNAGGTSSFFILLDGVTQQSVTLSGANQSQFLQVNIPGSARFLTLITTSDGGDGGDWSFFGNAQIAQVVPEPATVSLLLLAGAGLLRRRRD